MLRVFYLVVFTVTAGIVAAGGTGRSTTTWPSNTGAVPPAAPAPAAPAPRHTNVSSQRCALARCGTGQALQLADLTSIPLQALHNGPTDRATDASNTSKVPLCPLRLTQDQDGLRRAIVQPLMQLAGAHTRKTTVRRAVLIASRDFAGLSLLQACHRGSSHGLSSWPGGLQEGRTDSQNGQRPPRERRPKPTMKDPQLGRSTGDPSSALRQHKHPPEQRFAEADLAPVRASHRAIRGDSGRFGASVFGLLEPNMAL
jgi:hypothetical protein